MFFLRTGEFDGFIRLRVEMWDIDIQVQFGLDGDAQAHRVEPLLASSWKWENGFGLGSE
jgi:hypothetical protein